MKEKNKLLKLNARAIITYAVNMIKPQVSFSSKYTEQSWSNICYVLFFLGLISAIAESTLCIFF